VQQRSQDRPELAERRAGVLRDVARGRVRQDEVASLHELAQIDGEPRPCDGTAKPVSLGELGQRLLPASAARLGVRDSGFRLAHGMDSIGSGWLGVPAAWLAADCWTG